MDTPVEWPPENRRIADPEHLKAIGLFSLSFNYAEDTLRDLFLHLFPSSEKYAGLLFKELSNRKRVDMLREIVIHNENEHEKSQLILAALNHFDICTENRNIIMHATNDIDSSGALLRLLKRSRNNPDEINDYDIPLETLRKVAEESGGVFIFLAQVLIHLRDQAAPTPLPDIPAQPHRLSPSPRPATAGA